MKPEAATLPQEPPFSMMLYKDRFAMILSAGSDLLVCLTLTMHPSHGGYSGYGGNSPFVFR
jgi:hypothetical protein